MLNDNETIEKVTQEVVDFFDKYKDKTINDFFNESDRFSMYEEQRADQKEEKYQPKTLKDAFEPKNDFPESPDVGQIVLSAACDSLYVFDGDQWQLLDSFKDEHSPGYNLAHAQVEATIPQAHYTTSGAADNLDLKVVDGSGQMYAIAAAPINYGVTINDARGDMLVEIDTNTGDITFSENYHPDEAAKQFWQAMGDWSTGKQLSQAEHDRDFYLGQLNELADYISENHNDKICGSAVETAIALLKGETEKDNVKIDPVTAFERAMGVMK